jgi:pSer/pThr/pTyr-binding forkhead associated (FHA) protein
MPDQDDPFEHSVDEYLALSANSSAVAAEERYRKANDLPFDNTAIDYYGNVAYPIGTHSPYSQSQAPSIKHNSAAAPSDSFQPKLPNFLPTTDPQYLYNYETNLYYDVLSDTYSRLDETTMTYDIVSAKDAADTLLYHSNEPATDDTLRLVVLESQLLPVHNIILVDANGITIGRDRSWDRRLRLPEMAVSKYHCHIFSNTADIFQDADEKQDSKFSIIDVGSQNGTFVNGERLSLTKSASAPYPLRHLDVLSVGTTKFQVHEHIGSWPCEQCKSQNGNIIDIAATTLPKALSEEPEVGKSLSMEQARREELRRLKQKYSEGKPSRSSGNYVDRADARRKQHVDRSPVTRNSEMEVGNDQAYVQQASGVNVRIGTENFGNRLLQKMGWKEGQGLGSSGSGILEPIRAEYREGRAGLGSPSVEEPLRGKGRSLQVTRQRYNELS